MSLSIFLDLAISYTSMYSVYFTLEKENALINHYIRGASCTFRSSSEQQPRIRKQFDSFCKTLLKNEMIDYERERNYRLKYEISFSELTQKELRQLEIMDDYIVESEMFHVFDYDIEVKDELIGEALKSLPEKKRNVILLSFFLGMTDTEIAKYMNLVRSTIHHHRTSSLIALKKIMEEIRTGKKK